jgi:hypothetical protein
MKGSRFNGGKPMLGLETPYAREVLGRVLTMGAGKYGTRNWQKGMEWSTVLDSLERHLNAFKAGEDYDVESGELHMAHVMCNAMFLVEYYRIAPWYDDRDFFFDKRVGLDIDGVIADFNSAARDIFDTSNDPNHWHYSYELSRGFTDLSDDFWMGIKPYDVELEFEPECYVTQRPCDVGLIERWIEDNGFPCSEVIVVGGSKLESLKGRVDIFVDDKYSNFLELNKGGVFTYLMDRPWNRKYNVGHFRINDLNDIVSRCI